jgi:hypothetical protein
MGDELMNAEFTMDGLEVMAQMLEVLVARIETLEKKLNEQCSCKKWANDLRPGLVIFEPCTLGRDLTQDEVEDLMTMKSSEIMPQG